MKPLKSIYLFLAALLIFSASCKKVNRDELTNKERASEKGATLPNRSTCSFCDLHYPVGGGTGYSEIVTTGTTVITSTIAGIPKTPTQLGIELTNAVNSASTGDIIFLEGDCDVLVTSTIHISAGITIASDRGNGSSLGAYIIYSPTIETGLPLFDIHVNRVRISGLRIQGHQDYSYGIQIYNVRSIIIDNNEFYDWMDVMRIAEFHPVSPSNEYNALTEQNYFIHNNYIHHNTYGDHGPRGYGISIENAFVQIYANQFEYNRHDVAAAGYAHSGFNLYCNIFGDAGVDINGNKQQNIDIHGAYGFAEYYASGFMHIHHNDFLYENPSGNIYPVGKPTTLMLVDNNKFKASTIYWINNAAILQRPYTVVQSNIAEAYGNLVAVNNTFNGTYLGWYVKEDWNPNSTDNFVRIPSSNDLLHGNLNLVSGDFTGSWIDQQDQILDYYFGDFDGDGKTDIFKSDGGKWYYLPLNTNYANSWIYLADSQEPLGYLHQVPGTTSLYKYMPNLILDNFNADATTDVFVATGTQWNVSYSATSAWTYYASSGYTLNNTLRGKFFHPSYVNQIMDVFRTDVGQWYISYDGSAWTPTTTSPLPLSQFKVGDFDNDGFDDIFRKTGSNWYYSSNASGSWIYLNFSPLHQDKFVIGDFYGDGKSDVIGSLGQWSLSLSGTSTWMPLSIFNFPLSGFQFGDLD